MFVFYLLAFILIGTSYVDTAPISSSVANNPDQNNEVKRILKDAMFNSTDNFYIIKKVFQVQPGTHKICISIAYNITCDDQPKCKNPDSLGAKCTSGYYQPVLWAEFDPSDLAGGLLFFFASNGFTVFGFDWADACDIPELLYNSEANLDHSAINFPTLNLVVPSLPCSNSTALESEINQTLLYLTILVSVHYQVLVVVALATRDAAMHTETHAHS